MRPDARCPCMHAVHVLHMCVCVCVCVCVQLFKGLLSQRLHKGASSVRSVTTADGGESVGAATVTGTLQHA